MKLHAELVGIQLPTLENFELGRLGQVEDLLHFLYDYRLGQLALLI